MEEELIHSNITVSLVKILKGLRMIYPFGYAALFSELPLSSSSNELLLYSCFPPL